MTGPPERGGVSDSTPKRKSLLLLHCICKSQHDFCKDDPSRPNDLRHEAGRGRPRGSHGHARVPVRRRGTERGGFRAGAARGASTAAHGCVSTRHEAAGTACAHPRALPNQSGPITVTAASSGLAQATTIITARQSGPLPVDTSAIAGRWECAPAAGRTRCGRLPSLRTIR